jgi:hypothetical protein
MPGIFCSPKGGDYESFDARFAQFISFLIERDENKGECI